MEDSMEEMVWNTDGVDYFFWVVIVVSVSVYMLYVFVRSPEPIKSSNVTCFLISVAIAALVALMAIFLGIVFGENCASSGNTKVSGYLVVLLGLVLVPGLAKNIKEAFISW